MSSKLKEIFVFNNGVITSLGMSGSDNRALNWSRIWSETYDVTLVIPYAAIDRYSDCKARKFLLQKTILTLCHRFTGWYHIFLERAEGY